MTGKRNWKFIVFLPLALFLLSTLAQTVASNSVGGNLIYLPLVLQPAEHWIHHYGDDSRYISEAATGVIPTQDSGLVLLIEQGLSPTEDTQDDFVIVKISTSGGILWEKGLGSFDVPDSYLNGQETSDGGLILGGLSHQGNNGAQVIKMTAAGDIQWQRNLGGENLDYATSIQQTADGGYIFTGFTGSDSYGFHDMWLVKLTANGTTQWQKTVGLSAFQFGNALHQTSDGGYIVAGQVATGSYIYDLWVVKFTANGLITWQKRYGGSEQDYGRDILQTSDDSYLVVGQTESAGAGESDGWMMKLNNTGDIVWQKSYGGQFQDEFNAIYPTNDGRFLIAGTTESFGFGSTDTWLLLVNGNGSIIWEKTYGSQDEETGDFVQQLADGKIMVTGFTTSYGNGASDAWVLKLDPNGIIANCDLIGTSAAIVMNTTVIPQTDPFFLRDSQLNAFASNLPSLNANIQVTQLCGG